MIWFNVISAVVCVVSKVEGFAISLVQSIMCNLSVCTLVNTQENNE